MSEVSSISIEEMESGKRYRISFDGTWLDGILETHPEEANGVAFALKSTDFWAKHITSIEKLQDPEPEWVVGAVVKCPGRHPYLLSVEGWVSTGRYVSAESRGKTISNAWRDGTLVILYTPEG